MRTTSRCIHFVKKTSTYVVIKKFHFSYRIWRAAQCSFSFYLHSLIQLWYILDSSLLLWRWMNELPNLLTLTYVFNQVIPLFDSEECGQVYTNEYIFDTVIFLIIKQLKWCLFSSGFDHGPNCVTKWMEWHKSLLNVFCTVLKKITMDKKVSNVSSGGSRIWP